MSKPQKEPDTPGPLPDPKTAVQLPPTAECSKPLPTPTGENTPSEFITFVEDHGVSAQAPETPSDHGHGNLALESPPLPLGESRPYDYAKSQILSEIVAILFDPTREEAAAGSHRRSKTEFNSILENITLTGQDVARGPDTSSQAHRRSSTEFNRIVSASRWPSF
ncbi:hypothetical protein CTA2_7245 [Colletotrichum tanaceti]|uniref:Uncharacterized protein n=1 Tax=Colletotrichum tanaceti TaxID=1306861 RepID=A0A4U6XNE2_9PEZI|nr:hypothetical protein CTA2_7245 [Colletotrichum tanaceti]TKW57260.1 hypothetical protein CTA1_2188 [Colletotrichum tanaceti]